MILHFQVNGTLAVDAIDFFVTHYFGEQLFNSCKDVKFGSMNTRAMDFVGAGAQNYAGENCMASFAFSCKRNYS